MGGCSSGEDEAAPETTTSVDVSTTSTTASPPTTKPTFTGDPDSPFCALAAEGDQRPVLSPFEADLDPDEIELRLRNLRNRFSEFSGVAPPELKADLAALVVALDDTDEALEGFDYDLDAMAEAGYTIGTLDDPVFEIIGFRLAEYRAQVCTP